MTQTLQEALLKAGLVSKEKLQKADADKKAAERAKRMEGKPRPPQQAAPHKAPPRKAAPAPRAEVPPKKKSLGFIEGKHHHHSRTDCESCGKTSPDVEYYEHKNRSLDKYWLCVKCADDHNIHDDFRQTVQSPQAMKGLFQRGYGPTKMFRAR